MKPPNFKYCEKKITWKKLIILFHILSWSSSLRLCWSGARGWHRQHFPCESCCREVEKKAEHSNSPSETIVDERRSLENLILHLVHNSNRQQSPKHESISEWILQLIQIRVSLLHSRRPRGVTGVDRYAADTGREDRGDFKWPWTQWGRQGAALLCYLALCCGYPAPVVFLPSSSSRFQRSVRSSCSHSNEPHPLTHPLL